MRKPDFSEVKAFIAKGDTAARLFQWKVGDLLIDVLGPPRLDDSSATRELARLSRELEREGADYATTTLRALRLVSFGFVEERRHYNLSYGVHVDARDPDTLDWIIAHAPKGQAIVQAYVRDQARMLEVSRTRELETETKRRRLEAELARKDRERAEKEAQAAKTPPGRLAAQRRAEEARQREDANRTPPTRKDIPRTPPAPEAMPGLIAKAKFDLALSRAKDIFRELDACSDAFPHFTPTEVEHAASSLLELMNWSKTLADRARSGTADKRSHLAVVA